MKIERINDSQIRCTLSGLDLSERSLNLSELAYGSEKARRLFREMVQKASAEVGFEAEDIPLMIEAIPLSNESVVLVITKVDDPEEMDTRFSRFAPSPDSDPGEPDINTAEPGLEGAGAPFTALRDEAGEDAVQSRIRVFVFRTLDSVIDAARAVNGSISADSRLYKNPQSGSYYLVLRECGTGTPEFAALCNRLAEYGTRIRQNCTGDSFYQEHYDVFLKEHALESLAKI